MLAPLKIRGGMYDHDASGMIKPMMEERKVQSGEENLNRPSTPVRKVRGGEKN